QKTPWEMRFVRLCVRRFQMNIWLQSIDTEVLFPVFHARETIGDGAAGEAGHPALLAREQADGGKAGRLAHVEPVRGAVGHADEISLDAQDVVDPVVDVQGEQACTVDEEA